MGGGGGGGDTTTVQKADPWSGVQPHLSTGYNMLRDLYTDAKTVPGANWWDPSRTVYSLAGGPQYFPGQTVASTNPLEAAGQNSQLAQLSRLAQLGGSAQQGVNSMVGGGSAASGAGLSALQNAINQLQSTGGGAAGQQAMQSAINQLRGSGQQLIGKSGTQTFYQGRGGAQQGMEHLLAAGDVTNNPYLQGAMQAAIRPVQQQFTEQVMPGIRQGAMEAGQMGSSRQGVAEGIASRGYLDTISDLTSQMGSQAYGQGLQAVQAGGQLGQGIMGTGAGLINMGLDATQAAGQLGQGMYGLGMNAATSAGQLGQGMFGTGMEGIGRGTALSGLAQQALMQPGQMQEQIGQQRTADQQAQIDANMARWNYQQQLPYSMLSDYLGILSGAPGGTTASTMSGASGGQNRLMSGLGGAASGAGMGSVFGPWGTAIGAGIGGLYGLFG